MERTVLITGASSGIGRAIAKQFAADGSDLVLVARRVSRLYELAAELKKRHGTASVVIPTDLTNEEAVEELLETLSRSHVDIIVNNAGFGAHGHFWALPEQNQIDQIRLNIVALIRLTYHLLPSMINRGNGGIINVGSMAGFQPGPGMAVYFATKAFVQSFTEALAEELRGTGITVTCLAPGATATEFAQRARHGRKLRFQENGHSANYVADRAYRGFQKGRAIVIPGIQNRLGVILERFVPRAWTRRLVSLILKTKEE